MWDAEKAADAKLIAAKFKVLFELRGPSAKNAWEKYLPGYLEGRREGWSTEEVLAAMDRVLKEPTA